MSEKTTTLAQRVKSEFVPFKGLRKSHPHLFYLMLFVGIGFAAMWIHEKFFGKAELEQKVSSQTQQILLLETQLAPFKTIALQRYPGQLADGLSNLADDVRKIEARINAAERKVRMMSVSISLRVKAQWKDDKTPDTADMIRLGGGDEKSMDVVFELDDGSKSKVEFYGTSNLRFKGSGGGITEVSYFATAAPTGNIFGQLPERILKISTLNFSGAISPGLLKSKAITVQGFEAVFSVNGKPAFNLPVDSPFDANLGIPGFKVLNISIRKELPVSRIGLGVGPLLPSSTR